MLMQLIPTSPTPPPMMHKCKQMVSTLPSFRQSILSDLMYSLLAILSEKVRRYEICSENSVQLLTLLKASFILRH